MNLAIRGIGANLGKSNADSFHNDLHKDLKSDFVVDNPPFKDSDWGGERLRQDVRWAYGAPPTSNANFAWVQHIVSHLLMSAVRTKAVVDWRHGSTTEGRLARGAAQTRLGPEARRMAAK